MKQLGSRAGNWLNRDQARLLLEKSDGESLRCTRDVAMISILLGCGLRRAELVSLRKEEVQSRQGHWAIVDLVGKRRPCSHGPGAGLGKKRCRQMDGSSECHGRSNLQGSEPARNSMGQRSL